ISSLKIAHLFNEYDIDYDPILILRREINPAGKSRAFLNDTPVNLTQLREIGERLVDIHSQHALLSLTDNWFQLDFFDSWSNIKNLADQYRSQYISLNKLKDEFKLLAEKENNTIKEKDYLSFLYDELSKANLKAGEKESLETELRTLSHTEDISHALRIAQQLLQGNEPNLVELTGELLAQLRKIASFSPSLQTIQERLESLTIELADLTSDIEKLTDQFVLDPQRLEIVSNRLNIIYHLEQKHRVSGCEALISLTSDIEKKISGIDSLRYQIEELQQSIKNQNEKLINLANTLSQQRTMAAPACAERLRLLVRQLGMPQSEIEWRFDPLSDYGPDGKERISLLFSANSSNLPRPVSQIASGGELSRIMLCIKQMLSEHRNLPTLILDEIDSGISGEIAGRMASMMHLMSKSMQVITITHLPQIAGKADFHLLVFKDEISGKPKTNIKFLDLEGRKLEIAKMLSNEQVTDASMAAADELIARSEK
ncbi:MAG TPA: hypothetical protein VLH16_00200, partial [Bacteroidales bacterium]|nr:hypothetical protein [Bacteroidales bacterium]